MRRPAEEGQATVELALLLPFVVALLLAVIQVGLVARSRVAVINVAREAARAAAVDPRPEVAEAAALGAGGLDPSHLAVELSGGTASGEQLSVTVTYAEPTDVPLVGALVPDVALSSTVVMRVE